MRTFLAMLVGAAVLATAVVSVRLHLHVAHLRYRLWALDQDRLRAEREQRLARADLEAAKAPRRLLERWAELRDEAGGGVPVVAAPVPVPAIAPVPDPRTATPAASDGDAAEESAPPPGPRRAPPRSDAPDEPQPVDEEGGR